MLKKICFPLLFIVLLASGCNSGPEYTVTLMQPLYASNEEVPFTIRVTENDKPAKGLDIVAETDMVQMAHGASQTRFKEEKDGVYSGTVKIPMTGKYKIEMTIKNGNKETKKEMEYTVKPAQ
ncbi:hypothetical protein A8F94_20670 [Bacillus sp. FJAT-27225]|uniref:FixH family protein n=1 Tax=Bacillus sp. FJAT-27225 TaxID=1743144 RepID=UPI00080C3009|nr:FixH family protein [Bacillus sp. FJAT-27225]OCA82325.1 hypothetical protein A8F94_20670 [Bacillus sp. FJAT-27225]